MTKKSKNNKPSKADVVQLGYMRSFGHASTEDIIRNKMSEEFQLRQTEVEISSLKQRLSDAQSAKRTHEARIRAIIGVLAIR